MYLSHFKPIFLNKHYKMSSTYKFYNFNFSRFLGLGFTPEERQICEKLKAEIDQYLSTEALDKNLIKLLVISFNETAKLGMDESIPVLKNVLSSARHRLTEGNTYEFKRLLVLFDAFIRNCGFRAQILIGRKKFLDTICGMALKYKEINLPSCQECAALGFDCIQAWSEAFGKYKEYFPFYEEAYLNLKHKCHVQFPRPENDKSRNPIPIELFMVAEKFTSKSSFGKNVDDSDGTASDSSDDHSSSSNNFSFASSNVSDQKVTYMQNTRSGLFFGSPTQVN